MKLCGRSANGLVAALDDFKQARIHQLAAALDQDLSHRFSVTRLRVHQAGLLPLAELHQVIGILAFELAYSTVAELGLESAPQKLAEHRMKAVLIDVTGLDLIDEQIAALKRSQQRIGPLDGQHAACRRMVDAIEQ